MYCGNVILRYGYPHGTDELCTELASLPQWQLDRFCVEILTLEDFYQRSVGRWATEMPWAFKGQECDNFYSLSIRKELSTLMAVPGWDEIKQAQRNGQFEKQSLLEAIDGMSRKRFAQFCAVVFKLEHHYCWMNNLAYTDKVDKLELKSPTKQKDEFVFEVLGFDLNAGMHFRKLLADDHEEESNGLIEYE
jgi:hypothetical protein